MGKDFALTAIGRFRDELSHRGVTASKLVLFGSYATGKQHEWSDIDLIVVSPDFEGKGLWERIQQVTRAILVTHAPIEPIMLTPAEWADENRMICQIARETGEVVYSADA